MPYGNSDDFRNPCESYEQSKQFAHPNLDSDVIEDVEQAPSTAPTPAARDAKRNDAGPSAVNNVAVVPKRSDSIGSIGTGDAGAKTPQHSRKVFTQRPSLNSIGDAATGAGGVGGMDDIYEEDEEEQILDEQEANMMMLGDEDEIMDGEENGYGAGGANEAQLNEDDVIRQLLPQPPGEL